MENDTKKEEELEAPLRVAEEEQISVRDLRRVLSRYSDDDVLGMEIGTVGGAGVFCLFNKKNGNLVFEAREW